MYRTSKKNRATYVYTSLTGASVTLHPGKDGVTEADIAVLHRADDDECNNESQQHRNGRKNVTEILSFEKVDPDFSWIRDTSPLTDEIVISAIESQSLREAIAKLPEKQAKAIIAVRLEGMPAKEYAKLTNSTEQNVSYLIATGIKNLRKTMKQ